MPARIFDYLFGSPVRIARSGLLGAAVAALALAPLYGPARAQTVTDFMTMDVCVDAQDHVLMGLTPLDARCARHRDIRPGEPIPYELHSFPHATGGGCRSPVGSVAKVNVPIVKNGVTRTVSFYDHPPIDCGGGAAEGDGLGGKNGASIEWHDNAYGFIMGSWSPVNFSYWVTPACQTNGANSRRFFEGVPIAPTSAPTQRGVYFHRVFQSALRNGVASQYGGDCPARFNHPLTVWVRDNFTFTGGHTLDSLMSYKYSQSGPGGDDVGDALQLERTYWTREFGLSRWESWGRDDWVDPRSNKNALAFAQHLYQTGVCSRPYGARASMSADMTSGAIQLANGAYSQTITDRATGQTHTWYLKLCADFTNAVPSNDGQNLVQRLSPGLNPAFWAE